MQGSSSSGSGSSPGFSDHMSKDEKVILSDLENVSLPVICNQLINECILTKVPKI